MTRQVDERLATSAHLLRTALSYLPNYALVVKDRSRNDEEVEAVDRQYSNAWLEYEASRQRTD